MSKMAAPSQAKDKPRPRFDVGALRGLAGDKVFARGSEYYQDGQVQILALEPDRVLAQVAGTDDYRTTLSGRGKTIDGDCSCPAFADWGFCKHMVAVALAANSAGADGETDGVGALGRIRAHLKDKGVDALVEMIVEIAERDPDLFRKLDMAAAMVGADDRTIEKRLRKAIDDATRVQYFIEYREAADWARGVDSALDAVADLASDARAGLALKLAERAVDRIEQAIEQIDDSDGHCGALLERARDVHLAAARAARPDPVQFAHDLFAREMEDDYGAFRGAVALYADMLGEAGLAEYRRLAAEAWAKLPPRGGSGRAKHESPPGHYRLQGILDFFAERDGDVDARIALRAKDLTSPWSYLQLAEFCLAQGRKDEALRRAEEGLWLFEDGRPDERLVVFAAGLLSKAGRKGDAEAHLWRAFERAPSFDLYARLRKLGGAAARERAVRFLDEQLVREKRTPWHYPADLLISILTHERMFDAAWAAVCGHGASRHVKEALARASESTHPQRAVAAYAERIEDLVGSGGNPAYAEAAKLIAHVGTLRDTSEQSAYVAGLRARFGRRRNFIMALDARMKRTRGHG
jgi:uncharacterized Zn finger protein